MLIDAGNNADSNLVVNYLKKNGVKKLDYAIGTHPHEDHIGSLDTVINNFEIGKVLMPKATSTTKTFKDVVTAIKNKNLKITEPIPGTTYNLGEASWTILAPSKNKDYEDANNYSIVCKLKYGKTSFIFTGDAEDVSEKEILAKGYDLKSDVLKIGHHGSSSSTTDAFLTAVNPKYAIISCGKGNDYGHPHKPTMDKLKSKKIPVYRTDECGTIVCISDGTKITFDKKPGDYNYTGTGTSNKSSSSTSTQSNSQNTNTSTNSNKTVYFTPSGKSYHFDKNCSTLKRSKKILQGSLQEAINSGHKDPCNVCAGGN
jgi:competence protein ComEC